MSEYKDPNLRVVERLLGIVDIREQFDKDNEVMFFEACFKYEIQEFKLLQGGAVSPLTPTYREEWRKITEEGCFPKYKVT